MSSPYFHEIPSVPKETARAASAIFGRRNFYILIGDHLGQILEQLEQPAVLEGDGPPQTEDVTLPLITFFQFFEDLTDAQASNAVQTRIDWKFALHLSLFPGMLEENALCQFRQRMLSDGNGQRLFQWLIDRLIERTPPLNHNFQNLRSLKIVSVVCFLNRLRHAQQAMSQALEVLAVWFPQWLRKIALPHWYGRYNPTLPRLDVAILHGKQQFLMEDITSDIQHLLEKARQSNSREIRELREVKVLEQFWGQKFRPRSQSTSDGLETLSIRDCEVCSYKGVGRRHLS